MYVLLHSISHCVCCRSTPHIKLFLANINNKGVQCIHCRAYNFCASEHCVVMRLTWIKDIWNWINYTYNYYTFHSISHKKQCIVCWVLSVYDIFNIKISLHEQTQPKCVESLRWNLRFERIFHLKHLPMVLGCYLHQIFEIHFQFTIVI